jgi:CDP-paratose 2-epimerase
VRDNIGSAGLVAAFNEFHRSPRAAAVYNIGGAERATALCSRQSSCVCELPVGAQLGAVRGESRDDHRWWISDLDAFRSDYPDWDITYDVEAALP